MNKRKLVFGFEFEVQFPPKIAVAMTPYTPERVQMDPAGADPDCSGRSSSISQILRESVHKSFEK